MSPTKLILSAAERLSTCRDPGAIAWIWSPVRAAILMLAEGATYTQIHARLGRNSWNAAMWKQRFLADRLAGLRAPHRGSKPTTLTPAVDHRILAKTRDAPADGSTYWSYRRRLKS